LIVNILLYIFNIEFYAKAIYRVQKGGEILMELKKLTSKKGIQLSQAFGAVLTLVLVSVLVIIAIFLFVTLSDSFDANSVEANASDDMVNEFSNYTSLIGLVGTIIFLGLVIGVLVASFCIRR